MRVDDKQDETDVQRSFMLDFVAYRMINFTLELSQSSAFCAMCTDAHHSRGFTKGPISGLNVHDSCTQRNVSAPILLKQYFCAPFTCSLNFT